jgi:hypothetical protein
MSSSYHPPVDQLLRRGELKDHDLRLDRAAAGLTVDDVPELIRMATDAALHDGPGNSAVVWAPVHAWRALAALKAEAAILPLLGLLGRVAEGVDDWVQAEVPMVLGELGGAALRPLTSFLADSTRDDWTRIAAAEALSELGQRHPSLRTECVTRLAAQLDRFANQSETVNSFLISALLDLGAVEALPSMEGAFASGQVDESVVGDLEDAEIALGLKAERAHPPKPNRLTELGAKFRGQLAAALVSGADPDFDGAPAVPLVGALKLSRNDPCPCGSGKKFKKCCG